LSTILRVVFTLIYLLWVLLTGCGVEIKQIDPTSMSTSMSTSRPVVALKTVSVTLATSILQRYYQLTEWHIERETHFEEG